MEHGEINRRRTTVTKFEKGFDESLDIFGEGVPWLGAGVQPGFCIYGFGEHWVSQG